MNLHKIMLRDVDTLMAYFLRQYRESWQFAAEEDGRIKYTGYGDNHWTYLSDEDVENYHRQAQEWDANGRPPRYL